MGWNIAPYILNFGAKLKWMVWFTLLPFYSQINLCRYAVNGRLVWPYSRFQHCWKRNIYLLPEIEPRFLGSPAHGLVSVRTELSRLCAYVLYTTKSKAVSVTWQTWRHMHCTCFILRLWKCCHLSVYLILEMTVPTEAVVLWNLCRCYIGIRSVAVLVMTGYELNLSRNCGKWTEDVGPFRMHMHTFISNSNNALTEYVALTHRGHLNQGCKTSQRHFHFNSTLSSGMWRCVFR